MTPSTLSAVIGSFRLVAGDRRGLAAMDASLDGFWRSFSVMVWLAPTVALSILADIRLGEVIGPGRDTPAALVIFAGVVNYVFGWIAFPLFLALLGRPLGVGRVFVPWMVARNWTAIPASLPYVLVVVVWLLGLLPIRLLGPLTLASVGFSLYCGWRVARIAGDRAFGVAVAYTLVDFLLGLTVETAADRLLAL